MRSRRVRAPEALRNRKQRDSSAYLSWAFQQWVRKRHQGRGRLVGDDQPRIAGYEHPTHPYTIPSGRHFHARCQVPASGEAGRAGVADACRNQDLEVLDGGGRGQVAYHWARARTDA